MDTEIWKPIHGFEGYYEISNTGEIRSVSRTVVCSGKIHGQTHHRHGMKINPIEFSKNKFYIRLYKHGEYKYYNVGTLLNDHFEEKLLLEPKLIDKRIGDIVNSQIQEIWKPIEGYEGYYEVSNTGKVRSVKRTICLNGKREGQVRTYKGKEIQPLRCQDHSFVKLHKEGQPFSISVSKLVATHFLEGFKESGRSNVKHKDGDPFNCCIDNLE